MLLVTKYSKTKQSSNLHKSWDTVLEQINHDDVFKWKHFPLYWPFVRGIHRLPVNSPQRGQWCGALMFSVIYAWINGCVDNCEVGDLRRHRAHYDVIAMLYTWCYKTWFGYHRNTERCTCFCNAIVYMRSTRIKFAYNCDVDIYMNSFDAFRHQAITRTNADSLLIRPLRNKWNFSLHSYLSIDKRIYKNVVCRMVAILFMF